jgi:Tol biopolymer transport system component
MDSWGKTPLWTPDGKQFIIAMKTDQNDPNPQSEEFFAVSRNGEVSQLTHFMEFYTEINIPNNYSLSPNGRLLAFWIVAKPSLYDDARLGVLNIETGEVTNYCIRGDSFDDATTPNSLAEPVWSPDSNQLLVISRNPQDVSIRRVVLIDIIRQYAAQIGEDVEPVGWMVTP